jgi:hypothetical protein
VAERNHSGYGGHAPLSASFHLGFSSTVKILVTIMFPILTVSIQKLFSLVHCRALEKVSAPLDTWLASFHLG